MTTKSHCHKRDTSSWRDLFKVENFLNRHYPIHEIISSEATVKFWNVNFETIFPAVIIAIPLSQIFEENAAMLVIFVIFGWILMLVPMLLA